MTNHFDIVRFEPSMADEWNDFVAHSRQGTFLFNRRYMDYHADRFADHSLMFHSKGHLRALLPANAVGDTLWSHQGLTYGGLLTDDKVTAVDVRTMLEEMGSMLRKQGFCRVVYKPIPWIYHRIPSEEDLFALTNTCHARLAERNISSAIRLSHPVKWRRDRRWKANKAHAEGIVVEQSNTEADLKSFWNVLTENLLHAHNATPTHNYEEISLLRSAFPDNIKLYVAKHDERVLAGVLLFITPRVTHAQYISANSQGKQLHAIDAIFKTILANDHANDAFFDFGISTENHGQWLNEGLIAQKEGFGARAVCYDWYEWQL